MKEISFVFLLLSLLAEIIGTIGGFGSSVFFVPIANFYFDFHSVLGLTALYHLSSNLSKILLFKKGLDKSLLINMGIPSVLFVVIGGLTSRYINSQYLEIILGAFLIVLSLLFLADKGIRVSPNHFNSRLGGMLSGLSAGLRGARRLRS